MTTYRQRLEERFPRVNLETNVTFGDLFGIADILDQAPPPRVKVQGTNPIANMVEAWAEPEFEAEPSNDKQTLWAPSPQLAAAAATAGNLALDLLPAHDDPVRVRNAWAADFTTRDDLSNWEHYVRAFVNGAQWQLNQNGTTKTPENGVKQTPGQTAYEVGRGLVSGLDADETLDWPQLSAANRANWETIGNAVVDRHGVIEDAYKTVTGIIAFRRSIEFVRNQDGHCQFRIKVQAPPGNPHENGAEDKFGHLDTIAKLLGLDFDEPSVLVTAFANDADSSGEAQWKITLKQKDERIKDLESELSEMKIARDLWQNALVEVREAITSKDTPNLRDALNALDVLAWHTETEPVLVDAIRKAADAFGEFKILKDQADKINAMLKPLNLPGPSVAQSVEQLVERVEAMSWERERTLLILRTANKWFGLSEKETLEDAAEVLWSNLKSREHLRRAASALTQTTEPPAFGDALIKKLAKIHAFAEMQAVADGSDPSENGIRAIIVELAKTQVEIPTAQEFAAEWKRVNNWPAIVARHFVRQRLAPILAAKDARIAELEAREPTVNGKPFVEHLRDILGAAPQEGVIAAIERLQKEKADAEGWSKQKREEVRAIRNALGQSEHVGTLAEDVAALVKKREELENENRHLKQSLDQQAKLIGTDHAAATRAALENGKLESEIHSLKQRLIERDAKFEELEKRLAERSVPLIVGGKTPGEVWDDAFSACVRRAGLSRFSDWKHTSPETRAMSEEAAQAVLNAFGRQMVREALELVRNSIANVERMSSDSEYGKQWANVDELLETIDAERAKLGQAKSEDAKTNVADHRPAQDVIHQIREKVQNLDKYKFDFYKQGDRGVWDASFVKEEHVIEILDDVLATLNSPAKPTTYYLLSLDHSERSDTLMWWRPNRTSYTTNLLEAGKYSEYDALVLQRGARDKVKAVKVEIVDPLGVKRSFVGREHLDKLRELTS